MKKQDKLILILVIIFTVAFLFWANNFLDGYKIRILNLCAINIILALGLNIINGFTGLFSLGHAGFMAIGAYVSAILTMSASTKEFNFFVAPIISPLDKIELGFLPAILLAIIITGLVSLIIGVPVLRLKGDYLAIASLGFAEIIRIVLTNVQRLTNGALGLKGIPNYTNLAWSWSFAFLAVVFTYLLVNSSYGRALKAIREDEIAAEAMGINLFKHKLMAFMIGSSMAGLGGALFGNLLTSIEPGIFKFVLTFQILLIVVLGGMGSISGTIISAIVVTFMLEWLRFVESPMNILGITIPGISGMRMVIFSALLMIVILFYQKGFMGNQELSIDFIKNKYEKLRNISKKKTFRKERA
jgi:branched-chain amino acid transport system permease protein